MLDGKVKTLELQRPSCKTTTHWVINHLREAKFMKKLMPLYVCPELLNGLLGSQTLPVRHRVIGLRSVKFLRHESNGNLVAFKGYLDKNRAYAVSAGIAMYVFFPFRGQSLTTQISNFSSEFQM